MPVEYLQSEINMISTMIEAKKNQLSELIANYNSEINSLEIQHERLKDRRDSLTTASGPLTIREACTGIFERLDWHLSLTSEYDKGVTHFHLSNVGERPVIVHLVTQANRNEITELATAHMRHWSEHSIDAKPVLLLDAIEPNWQDDIRNMAAQKSICLMTTGQLLGCYVEIDLNNYPASSLRNNIVSTVGPLRGYTLIASEPEGVING